MKMIRQITAAILVGSCVSALVGKGGNAVRDGDGGPASRDALQSGHGPIARFCFEGTAKNGIDSALEAVVGRPLSFTDGVEGKALRVGPFGSGSPVALTSGDLPLAGDRDFSVQFWVRTVAGSTHRFVVLSQKAFDDNSLASQKRAGWVFYVSGGTWAWNMGSGNRRITYERDNGDHLPVNDGRWHQLTMTHNADVSEVRLYYDGVNWVSYHVSDASGFDFSNDSPLAVGGSGDTREPAPDILPAIELGAGQLQKLVDTFNGFGLTPLKPEELVRLVVDPRRVFERKVEQMAADQAAPLAFREAMGQVDWGPIKEMESTLMGNPYTVHQVLNFMDTAPLKRLYKLVDQQVVIREEGARAYGALERLNPPDFDMDDLAVWDRVLLPEEVAASYAACGLPQPTGPGNRVSSITSASWNIWHGGRHQTVEEHGWDSRITIAEILEKEGIDIVMMQETYSSGDFIAAELGYYFATTVDWDYLNQGANISVLSRYPITELHVQDDSSFMNVGVKVTLSQTQDLYAMSNWYGMNQFPVVFDFHRPRFAESERIPILFAGDFNAIPHTDGGDSPASRILLDAGFTDAFRSLFPDPQEQPGPTHRSGKRIDQLYYKGSGLSHTSTRLISNGSPAFPSDHFLIVASFDLNDAAVDDGK